MTLTANADDHADFALWELEFLGQTPKGQPGYVRPVSRPIIDRYDEWRAERDALTESEDVGDYYPTASEWQDSDDHGIELLHEVTLRYRALLRQLADMKARLQ